MTKAEITELDNLRRAEVERAVAPYEGVAPPVVLAKLRELSDRYWREHPVAISALRRMLEQKRVRSGTETIAASDDQANDATGTEQE